MLTKLSGNGGYSWWTRPVFFRYVTDMYFTAITNAKIWRAFKNSYLTNQDLDTSPEADDHNAPSIIVRTGKAKLAFFTRHGASAVVNMARATSSGLSFVDAGNLTHPGMATYTQITDSGDRVAVFSRVGPSSWRFFHSTNWGGTWSTSRELMNLGAYTGQMYLLIAPTGTAGIYNITAYGHPVSSDFRGLVFGQLDMATGDISTSAGVIANLDGTNLPLAITDLDDLAPATGDEVVRMFDSGTLNGHPAVAYAKWVDPLEAAYWFAWRDESGTWTHVDLGVAAGASFYPTSWYFGGMALDKGANGLSRIVLAREEAGTWFVETRSVVSDMTVGTPSVVASDGAKPLVRPLIVEDGSAIIYQRLVTYTDYSHYLMEYWMAD